LKKFITVLFLMSISAGLRAEPKGLLQCVVPAEEIRFVISLFVDSEVNQDKEALVFAIFHSKAKETSVFISMAEKGQTEKSMTEGKIEAFGIGQKFSQEGGALRDIGSLQLKYNELNDVFEGAVVAKGDLYPVLCEKVKAP